MAINRFYEYHKLFISSTHKIHHKISYSLSLHFCFSPVFHTYLFIYPVNRPFVCPSVIRLFHLFVFHDAAYQYSVTIFALHYAWTLYILIHSEFTLLTLLSRTGNFSHKAFDLTHTESSCIFIHPSHRFIYFYMFSKIDST